jgi:hypothetical protein
LRGHFELAVLHLALEQPPRGRIEAPISTVLANCEAQRDLMASAIVDASDLPSVHLASRSVEARKIREKRIAPFLLRRGWLLGARVTFGLWRRLWHQFLDRAPPSPPSRSSAPSRRPLLNEHIAEDGPTVFAHACQLGAEGIGSKRIDSTYRSGPCRVWIKVRNPASIAVQRERNEIWNRRATGSARRAQR